MTNNHFFVVGAQRSGTTYLYHLLDEHPEIEMAQPMRPEPKFFLQPNLSSFTKEDYIARHFSDSTDHLMRGEKSTSYIESDYAAKNIAERYPDAKIIILLRNPIARAISNYQFSWQNCIETESMDVAFREENQRRDNYDATRFSVSPYAYLQRGCYLNYIEMYQDYFPRANLFIYLFEELVGNTNLLQQLYQQLGVESAFIPPSLSKKYNLSQPSETPLTTDLKNYLAEYFTEPNQALADYLGRSLELWDEVI